MTIAHEAPPEESAQQSERVLLAGAARGDSASLMSLYDLLAPRLLGHLLTTGISHAVAESLVQRAFRALWVVAPRLPSDAPVLAHLVRLADLHR